MQKWTNSSGIEFTEYVYERNVVFREYVHGNEITKWRVAIPIQDTGNFIMWAMEKQKERKKKNDT